MARTALVYGEGGTYKSSNLGEVADYLCASRGNKPVRLITADSSMTPMADQIRRGVIHPLNLRTCENPLAVMQKLSKGWWFGAWRNQKEGVPDETKFRMPKDGELEGGVSGYMIEGLYMIGELVINDLLEKQRATGEPLSAVFQEILSCGETVNFSDASRGTYKFVQRHSYGYCVHFSSLPVPWVILSSHEGKGSDDNKRTIFGPALVGQATTDKIPQWFGFCLHHDSYVYRAESGANENGVRAWFERHPDSDIPNIFWPAKLGLEPRVMAAVKKQWSHGYVPLRIDATGNYVSGVHTLFQYVEQLENGANAK